MIKFKELSKIYPGGFQALNAIDLTINSGEIFGIIGKSGAGKSTLLRCINLLETPSSGEIRVDGENLTTLSHQELRLARFKSAMIFQHFNLLANKTVAQNIALAMQIQRQDTETIDKKIDELLELVELSDKKNHYPAELSGGQKQRVAIARALSCSPQILLCDEATSALDPNTTHAILNLLKKINRSMGITIVLITHEMEVIKQICHRVAVMEQGEIVETLNTEDIFNQTSIGAAKSLLSAQITPRLPDYLAESLLTTPADNSVPIARLFFYQNSASTPLISRMSRQLGLDINILQANIDAIGQTTFGVLIVELLGDKQQLPQFFTHCQQQNVTVEILGYVSVNVE